MSEIMLFTGGYTEPIRMGSGEVVAGRCPGITCYAFDEETGELSKKAVSTGIVNPSFLIVHDTEPYLYCVNERKDYEGIDGSTASAYKMDTQTGALTLLNSQFTCGVDACHLALSEDGDYLLGTNYTGGSVWVMPIREDHSLEPASCILRHSGSGTDQERQNGAHPHQIVRGPERNVIFIPDLGLDLIKCYDMDPDRGWLLPNPEKDIPGIPGQGIRHAVFDSDGQYLYAMTEMTCEVNVYAYGHSGGKTSLLQTVSAMPAGKEIRLSKREPDWTREPIGAGIRIHPSGKWLYAAVRRTDHLAVFEIMQGGLLKQIQTISCGGKIPREFILTPDGRFLLAANQDSDNLCEFIVDPCRGTLEEYRTLEEAPCVTTLAF